MNEERNEYTLFYKEELESLAKFTATIRLIQPIYFGNIHQQTVRWNEDGSIEVITRHTPKR